jgi:hypothetical protein
MIIPIKQDSANGELGVSSSFGDQERTAAERFKRQLLTDPKYLPEGLGAVPSFDSLVAAFYLVPEGRIAGLMWIYFDMEGLRRSLFITTFRIPLKAANPIALAASIERGRIDRESIRDAVRSGRFEVEIEDGLVGRSVEADPDSIGEPVVRDLPLVASVELEDLSRQRFFPFISFKSATRQGSGHSSGHSREHREDLSSLRKVAAVRQEVEVLRPPAVAPPLAKADASLGAPDRSKPTRGEPKRVVARPWDILAYLLLGSVLGGLLVGSLRTSNGTFDRETLKEIARLQKELGAVRQDVAQIKAWVRPTPTPAPPPVQRYVVTGKDVWLRSEPKGGEETKMGTRPLDRGQAVELKRLLPGSKFGEVDAVVAGQRKTGFVFIAGLEKKTE